MFVPHQISESPFTDVTLSPFWCYSCNNVDLLTVNEPVAGGRVAKALDWYVGGLPFKFSPTSAET